MPFTVAQVTQLLQPIRTHRVLRDGKGNNHLPQQDVLAHLIRVFGFGSFDYEMISCSQIFEQERTNSPGKYDVSYKAFMRLTVRDPDGNTVCRFEDGSTGSAENLKRVDAHDLAMKSAISLAKKRCAIALGDQFGLSLYNKGQTDAYVTGTMVWPVGETSDTAADVQEGTPAALSMGHDEVEHVAPADEDTPPPATSARPSTAERARQHIGMSPDEARNRAESMANLAQQAPDTDELNRIWTASSDLPDQDRENVRALCRARATELANPSQNVA